MAYRLGLVALLAGLAIVVGTGKGTASAADPHYVGCGSGITLPRTVSIGPGVDATLVRSAMAEWNQTFGTVFVEAPTGGDVSIIADSVTWVEMPCASTKSVIHVGTDVDLNYWMAHALGHTLGLADHIRSFDDPSRYINPGLCPNDGYVGIMSYCTPRELWFGPQDVQMMDTLWPELVSRVTAAPATVAATSGADAAGLVASPGAPVTTLTVRGFAPAIAAGYPAPPAPVMASFTTGSTLAQSAGSDVLQAEAVPGQPPVAEAPPVPAPVADPSVAADQQPVLSGQANGSPDEGFTLAGMLPIAIVLGMGGWAWKHRTWPD